MIENLPQQAERAARRQGSSRWASCRSRTSCRAAASPPAIARSSATTCWTTWRARASARSRSPRGGYLIRTTLDPDVQASVKSAIDKHRQPRPRRRRQRDERDQARQGRRIRCWRWPATAPTGSNTRRRRDHAAAAVLARRRRRGLDHSRSSPPPRRWRWAWASTRNAGRAWLSSRPRASAAAIRQAARRKPGA